MKYREEEYAFGRIATLPMFDFEARGNFEREMEKDGYKIEKCNHFGGTLYDNKEYEILIIEEGYNETINIFRRRKV